MKYSNTLVKILTVCLVFAWLFSSLFAYAAHEERIERTPREPRHPRDETTIVVKFATQSREQRIRVPAGQTVEQALKTYEQRGDVVYAEPNYIAQAFLVPNDSFYSYQWHVQQIGMEEAWDNSTGSGVVVAVIDTGIAVLSDLSGTSFAAGYDFANNDSNATDDNGHGTHVAGTIAQSTNNSLGVAGIAYGATLMPLKALNSQGSGTYADIADAIRFAADNGAHVINMSLGGSSPATYLEEALQYAHSKGVTIVAAAGNNGQNTISYPAAYDTYVIAVGATRFDKARVSYSNYGSSLDIVAPGGDTSVDQNGDGYVDGILQQTFSGSLNNSGYYFYQGTSMASPHVAGLAALVIAQGIATTPSEVQHAIESSAEDLGSAGWDTQYGHGLINAATALQGGSSTPPSPPPPSPLPPPAEPQVVFTESFENDLDSWTQDSQRDWRDRRQRATHGRYSAEVDGRANDAQLISPIIDLLGNANATVEFFWYIENRLDAGEYIAFDISADGGLTWQQQAILRGNQDEENAWHAVTIDVLNAENVQLRFRGSMSSSSEDANVDEISVTAW